MLNIVPIPAFKDNYIWLLHDGRHGIAVDPGDAAPVRAWLDANNIRLAAILCTHHHADHRGGICELVQVYNVPAYGPQREDIACISHKVGEGDVVSVAQLDFRLDVIDIPGHTLGHVAYLFSDAGMRGVFCGDTLFGCGCGRLFEGTPAQLLHSLQRLAQLPDDTRVYCAHEYTEANLRFALACEPNNAQIRQRAADARALRANGQPTVPSTIGLEKATNPFLRCDQAEVALAAGQENGAPVEGELAVFTALREWRNRFA